MNQTSNKKRLDIALTERGLLPSRSTSKDFIKRKQVYVNNKLIDKASFQVSDTDIIELKSKLKYVSRGALKLEKAMQVFNINFKDKIMLDIGSSTGGFTDLALQNNINEVIAVDVGTNQLHKSLRNNKKVSLFEQTDFRDMDTDLIRKADIITIDVSFISVKKLIPKLSLLTNAKELVLLIKPQFECGKEASDIYHGIILNKDIHKNVIKDLIKEFNDIHFYLKGITYSPLQGGSGNIEYLAYFTRNEGINIDTDAVVKDAFKEFQVNG